MVPQRARARHRSPRVRSPLRHSMKAPLIGYTVLEACNVVVDMPRHRLVARKHYDLKRAVA